MVLFYFHQSNILYTFFFSLLSNFRVVVLSIPWFPHAKKALCGKVRAYTSPANFMPQLMRVSYIRRVRARLSCGV